MKKLICVALAVLGLASAVQADLGFYAITNTIGYEGTIWNVTDGTGPWTTSTPRVGYLYAMVDYPGFANDYNYLLSDWSEHHASNTNDSFFQLAETNNPSVTSASGAWDATRKVFTRDRQRQQRPVPVVAVLAAGQRRCVGCHLHGVHLHLHGHLLPGGRDRR